MKLEKDDIPNSDSSKKLFLEWAVGHTAEKLKIGGTIIQKVEVIKAHNECLELK